MNVCALVDDKILYASFFVPSWVRNWYKVNIKTFMLSNKVYQLVEPVPWISPCLLSNTLWMMKAKRNCMWSAILHIYLSILDSGLADSTPTSKEHLPGSESVVFYLKIDASLIFLLCLFPIFAAFMLNGYHSQEPRTFQVMGITILQPQHVLPQFPAIL